MAVVAARQLGEQHSSASPPPSPNVGSSSSRRRTRAGAGVGVAAVVFAEALAAEAAPPAVQFRLRSSKSRDIIAETHLFRLRT